MFLVPKTSHSCSDFVMLYAFLAQVVNAVLLQDNETNLLYYQRLFCWENYVSFDNGDATGVCAFIDRDYFLTCAHARADLIWDQNLIRAQTVVLSWTEFKARLVVNRVGETKIVTELRSGSNLNSVQAWSALVWRGLKDSLCRQQRCKCFSLLHVRPRREHSNHILNLLPWQYFSDRNKAYSINTPGGIEGRVVLGGWL